MVLSFEFNVYFCSSNDYNNFLFSDFIRHSLLADAKCVCDIKGISSKDKSEIYQINDLFVCMVDKKLEVDKSQTGKFTETVSL